MDSQKINGGYVIRLDEGEEIMASLRSFAQKEGLQGGLISGLGTVDHCVLGFFDRPSGRYEKKEVREEMELIALTGNLSLLDGEPFPHLHIVLSRANFSVVAGHLFEATISVTGELFLLDTGTPIHRGASETAFRPLLLGSDPS